MRPMSSRTPDAPYWASCMPSTTRSNSFGLTWSGALAEIGPGSCFDETSTGAWRPRIGNRTTVPSRLINSAVGLVHTNAERCPAMASLVLNSEPYDAPRTSTLYFTIVSSASDRALLARCLDFVVVQFEDGPKDLFGMLAQQR